MCTCEKSTKRLFKEISNEVQAAIKPRSDLGISLGISCMLRGEEKYVILAAC